MAAEENCGRESEHIRWAHDVDATPCSLLNDDINTRSAQRVLLHLHFKAAALPQRLALYRPSAACE